MGFADDIAGSFPSGLVLPSEFRGLFDWMEETGRVHAYTRKAGRYGSLYPATLEAQGSSCIAFHPVDADQAQAWLGKDASAADRLAPFVRTGGDGSYIALWLDPQGRQRFVHLGSGSGSTWAGVVSDDPVQVLRFLAIGYDEACWPEDFDKTPAELWAERDLDDDTERRPPEAFQAWVRTNFAVTIPSRGREVVAHTPDMGDADANDAFVSWLNEPDGHTSA